MNILIIDQDAGSPALGMKFRPYYLAHQWVKLGHDVTIVAGSFVAQRSRQPTMSGVIERHSFDGVQYIFLKTRSDTAPAKRIWPMLSFAWQLVRHMRQIVAHNKPDIVISASSHPFDMAGAALVAHVARAPLVREIQEIWPDTMHESWSMVPPDWAVSMAQFFLKCGMAQAKLLVGVLPLADKALKAQGLAHKPYVHIPNGIDPAEWDVGDTHDLDPLVQVVIDRMRAEGLMIVGYAGAHDAGHELQRMVHAATYVRDLPIGFISVGDGPYKGALDDYAIDVGLSGRVVFTGAIPKRHIPRFLKQMDVLYVGGRNLPIYRYGVSFNKVFDYMMAGRPIIMAMGAGNDMVGEAGCGISVPSADPLDIAKAFEAFLAMSPLERDAMGALGKAHVLLHHAYPTLARCYAQYLAKIRH